MKKTHKGGCFFDEIGQKCKKTHIRGPLYFLTKFAKNVKKTHKGKPYGFGQKWPKFQASQILHHRKSY